MVGKLFLPKGQHHTNQPVKVLRSKPLVVEKKIQDQVADVKVIGFLVVYQVE